MHRAADRERGGKAHQCRRRYNHRRRGPAEVLNPQPKHGRPGELAEVAGLLQQADRRRHCAWIWRRLRGGSVKRAGRKPADAERQRRNQRPREAFDCYAFKSDRWEECVPMPGKMARSAPRPPFALPEGLAVVHTSRQSCRKAGKARIFTPVREPSRESQISGSHSVGCVDRNFVYGIRLNVQGKDSGCVVDCKRPRLIAKEFDLIDRTRQQRHVNSAGRVSITKDLKLLWRCYCCRRRQHGVIEDQRLGGRPNCDIARAE